MVLNIKTLLFPVITLPCKGQLLQMLELPLIVTGMERERETETQREGGETQRERECEREIDRGGREREK